MIPRFVLSIALTPSSCARCPEAIDEGRLHATLGEEPDQTLWHLTCADSKLRTASAGIGDEAADDPQDGPR